MDSQTLLYRALMSPQEMESGVKHKKYKKKVKHVGSKHLKDKTFNSSGEGH